MVAPNPDYPQAAPGGAPPAEDFEAKFARLELKALEVLEDHLNQGELNAVRVLLLVRSGLFEPDPEPDAPAGPTEVSWLDQE